MRKRWIIEPTFGWLIRSRRLVRDYERKVKHSEVMIHICTIGLMLRRLEKLVKR